MCLTETHKTITENGGGLERAMFFKMIKEEYKKEFSKRPSVEGPFTIFKEQYSVEQENCNRNDKNLRKTQPMH